MKRLRPTSRMRRVILTLAGVTLLGVLMVGCAAAANPTAAQGAQDAGFWLGIWHGFIAPIAFLVSLFDHTVGIYEVHNTGGWYNFGFLIGVSAFFSGSGAGAGARGRARSSKSAR